jgi:hypothetical protein
MNPKNLLRRRIIKVALGLTAATIGLGAVNVPEASAYWTVGNTAQTTTGAFLQSTGVCGYGQFTMKVKAVGFEYIQLGVAFSPGATPIWLSPVRVGPYYEESAAVPAFAVRQYYVRGWDATTNGWVSADVLTSFWYPHTGTNLNGC